MVLVRMLPQSYILIVAVLFSTAACGSMSPAATTSADLPTATAEQTPESTPSSTPEKTTDWEQVDVNGVRLGIAVPDGWEAQKTDDGLLIAEHFGTIETDARGMLMYLFVHSLDGFKLSQSNDANIAWEALEQISKKREYIGDALVSAPAGFEWDGQ